MRELFAIGPQALGDGGTTFAWSPRGALLAAAGSKLLVSVFDQRGQLLAEVHLAPAEVPPASPHQCCCTQLEWDAAGAKLAVLPAGCSFFYTWSAATRELQKLDTDFKGQEVTTLAWSACGSVLAAGTAKGNMQLHHLGERRKTPVLGKHSRRVVAGAWSPQRASLLLALAAQDKTLTLSDVAGDTRGSVSFKGEPLQLCAAAHAAAAAAGAGSERAGATFSLTTSKQLLYIVQARAASAAPAVEEVAFMEAYGAISQQLWAGADLLVGFRSGQVVVVAAAADSSADASASGRAGSRELHSHRPLDVLAAMAYSPAAGRVAVGGGGCVKLLDPAAAFGEAAEQQLLELPAGHSVERVGWGQGGQVLSVSTSAGLLITYLVSLPHVFAAAGTKHAALTSLSEVTVSDVAARASCAVAVDCDPAFVALGPHHLAAGINHQVLFYRHGLGPGGLTGAAKAPARPATLVARRSYLGAVQAVGLNATHAAVLTGGRVLMHAIEAAGADSSSSGGGGGSDEDGVLCVPAPGASSPSRAGQQQQQQQQQAAITHMALTHQFLITATAGGAVSHHVLQDGQLVLVNEHRHAGALTGLFPQPCGPRLVLADEAGGAGLYSPLSDELTPLPGFAGGALESVLWDEDDTDVFVAASSRGLLHTYLFTRQSLSGQRLELLGTMLLPAGHTPAVLCGGQLFVRLSTGTLDRWLLDTHRPLLDQDGGGSGGSKQLQKRLAAAIKLHRTQDALPAARALGTPDAWRQLAAAAVQQLDVRLAAAAYRQAGDAAMVMSLAALEDVEDRNLLAGSLLVLIGRDLNQAQELLLRSSRPMAALEMRQDLKHWPEALALAQQLAPERVPALSKEHAAALELVGDFEGARGHYQLALDALQEQQQQQHSGAAAGATDCAAAQEAAGGGGNAHAAVERACLEGMGRTLLHLGDLRGCALAERLGSAALWRECAAILEQQHHMQEAADAYVAAGLPGKAAAIHIVSRNWRAVGPLMACVASPKLQLAYARAKEAERAWAEAAAAYEAAGDPDAVVRLCLGPLADLPRAAALARSSRSTAAAAAVAKAALAQGGSGGDAALAVEFLLLAGQLDRAFDMAAAGGQLELFGRLAADAAKSPGEAGRMAEYLEARGQPEAAAAMWARAEQPERAVSLCVQVCTPSSLGAAVQLLESAGTADSGSGSFHASSSAAVPALLAALERCPGLAPHMRDALRLRVNMGAGQLGAAARDALDIARREQEEGSYKLAHGRLFSTLQRLQAAGAAPPLEFRQALALLHSYVLVRGLLAIGNHAGAARMLVRVAASISRFPKHVVPILTSTVVECQRAGLRRTALEHACTLMQPEHRPHVPEKYRRHIELLVRKPGRSAEEPADRLVDCPFCGLPGPACSLQCVGCQSVIPFDVATGTRMTLADWCECPGCRMPCSSEAMLAILAAEGKCPMCAGAVAMADVRPVADPLASAAARQ